MTTARHLLVDPDTPGYYHCISRCVRRAWLCGVDPYDGKSYEHRRAWVELRLLELAEIFAVGVYAYAVMSNHVHVVLRIDPTAAGSWSDEEVALRWVRLFPATVDGETDAAACRQKEQTLLGNTDRLSACRQRLGSLAWFMKALNEPIARRANREDACTGRFWEGRYKCQALLDEAAVLTCMSYVDLNPIRAGMAENLETSVHTSAVQRIESLRANPATAQWPLSPINSVTSTDALPITTAAYLDLIDALVITGGAFDVDPKLYGEGDTHPTVVLKQRRTRFEWAMTRGALDRDMPVLGICGGQQLLNVVLGGTLIQHIPDTITNPLAHEQPNPRNEPGHEVRIRERTLLHRLTGTTRLAVNSAHHQAVRDPGKGCIASACAGDGVIEAIEHPGYRYCLGVQWHPEFLITDGDRAILAGLVDAARAS